jgi:thiol-disulfide isomerase/thioredoxin
VRNAVLAVLATIVVVHGPGTSLDAWVDARAAAELAAVAIGIVAAVLATVCVRLWLDRRELRRDLEREREVTALFPPGLPVGAEAPPFTLEDTQGHAISLHALLERGRPLALIFVSPGCGPCEALLPDLARWQATLAERLTIGLVSTGDVLDNHDAHRLGLTDVLLQDGDEIMRAYRVESTPSAVMVSSDGRVASSATRGAASIEPLIRVTLRHHTSPASTGPVATNGAPAKQRQT